MRKFDSGRFFLEGVDYANRCGERVYLFQPCICDPSIFTGVYSHKDSTTVYRGRWRRDGRYIEQYLDVVVAPIEGVEHRNDLIGRYSTLIGQGRPILRIIPALKRPHKNLKG